MFKRIKLLNYGVDKLTRDKLRKDIKGLDNKNNLVLNVKYDIVNNRFYITY